MTILFYCESCGSAQQVYIEPAVFDELNGMPWGDIICKRCRSIIATYSADKEGVLMFCENAEAGEHIDGTEQQVRAE